MKPSRKPELAGRDPAVGERHRRLGQPAAGRHDLVEQVRLELADQRRERTGVGPDPARAIDHPGPLDDARQRGPERGRQRRHDPRHRLGVVRLGRAQLGRGQGARRRVAAGRSAIRSTSRPVHQAAARADPLGAAPDDGRRGAEGRAEQEARLPDAIVAPRRPASPERPVIASRATASSTLLDVGEGRAEQPARERVERGRVAGRQLAMRAAVVAPSAVARRLHAVDAQQLGQRGGRGRGRVDDRHALARPPAAISGRSSG